MKMLVTGGCGFLGTNLSLAALSRGEELVVVDNLARSGSKNNLQHLQEHGEFQFHCANTHDWEAVEEIVRAFKPEAVFHVAGQVAMTTSIEDPRADFQTNVMGGFNVLEAVRRHAPQSAVFYSSTNKVYGDLEDLEYEERDTRYVAPGYENGFDESLGLDFRSPYGCSKGATDQYMLDYARIFNIKTVVFRHSSIFGGRQYSTHDQGWIGWFVRKALETQENKRSGQAPPRFSISGNGKQVRDVLFADDLVACYYQALGNIDNVAGQVFNIGGGMQNSLSLLELFHMLEEMLDVKLEYDILPWRQSDQKIFVADTAKAHQFFGWSPQLSSREGVGRMIEWSQSNESRPN